MADNTDEEHVYNKINEDSKNSSQEIFPLKDTETIEQTETNPVSKILASEIKNNGCTSSSAHRKERIQRILSGILNDISCGDTRLFC
jgi:hypothetical protein